MRLWFTPLFWLLVLQLSSACSLNIDTSPDGLRQASAGSVGAMNAGAMSAGVMSAGVMSAGVMSAGALSAGEVIAGEMLAGNSISGEMMLEDQGFDVMTSQGAAELDAVDPLRSIRRSSTQTSEGLLSTRPQALSPSSFLRPLLPSADCVVEDMVTGECLTSLDRGDLSVCYDWQQNYPLTALTPWSGDRASCDSGSLDPAGIEDVARVLNLFRRQLRLNEVEVMLTDEAQRCALARDVLYRDQIATLNEESACYSDDLAAALNASYSTVVGSWAPYVHLHKVLGLTVFKRISLAQKINIRHTLLTTQMTSLSLGARGYSMCFRPETAGNLANPRVLTYPAPGVNPLAIVNPANHEGGSVPWSVALTGEVNDLTLSLSRLSSDGIRSSVELDDVYQEPLPERRLQDVEVFGFTFPAAPEPQVAYELDIQWRDATEARHIRVMIGFKDCGFTQSAPCTIFPDTCVVPGTRCAPFSVNNNSTRNCVFSGPLERGELCERLGTESCRSGVCISINDSSTTCGAICDTGASPDNATSCDQLCPEGTASFLDLEVCR